ncbi:MAG: lysophospholipid acyltransferase family protein, partial [Candidatus Omnitrophica bacterium]|nr:lysophospholipid acyltransferase family protein [Candidatus Omnitrophota bacterium]
MFKFYLYRLAHFVANRLPLDLLYKLAAILADIQYVFSFRDRRAVRKNLRTILPQAENIEAMTREVFHNFGKYLSEFFRMEKMVDKDFIAGRVKIEHAGRIQQVLNQGKGGIIITAHIGNWEMGAVVLSLLGYPLMAVALPHKERPVNDLFNHERQVKGITVIPTSGAIRKCMEHLKSNKLIAIVADRDFTVKGGELMDFLGARAMIPRGSAIFSLKTGAPLLPTFLIREKDNSFRFFILEPITPTVEEENLPEQEAIRSVMRRYLAVIEDQVRRYPTQWLMFREFAVRPADSSGK